MRNSVWTFLIPAEHRIFINQKWSVISGLAAGFGIEVKIGEIFILISYNRAVHVSKVDMINIQSSFVQCTVGVSERNKSEGAVHLKTNIKPWAINQKRDKRRYISRVIKVLTKLILQISSKLLLRLWKQDNKKRILSSMVLTLLRGRINLTKPGWQVPWTYEAYTWSLKFYTKSLIHVLWLK